MRHLLMSKVPSAHSPWLQRSGRLCSECSAQRSCPDDFAGGRCSARRAFSLRRQPGRRSPSRTNNAQVIWSRNSFLLSRRAWRRASPTMKPSSTRRSNAMANSAAEFRRRARPTDTARRAAVDERGEDALGRALEGALQLLGILLIRDATRLTRVHEDRGQAFEQAAHLLCEEHLFLFHRRSPLRSGLSSSNAAWPA